MDRGCAKGSDHAERCCLEEEVTKIFRGTDCCLSHPAERAPLLQVGYEEIIDICYFHQEGSLHHVSGSRRQGVVLVAIRLHVEKDLERLAVEHRIEGTPALRGSRKYFRRVGKDSHRITDGK